MKLPDLQPRWPLVACGVSVCLTMALVLSADSTHDTQPPPSPKLEPHPDAVFTDDFSTGKLDAWHRTATGRGG
jgi:hypothetical protein